MSWWQISVSLNLFFFPDKSLFIFKNRNVKMYAIEALGNQNLSSHPEAIQNIIKFLEDGYE